MNHFQKSHKLTHWNWEVLFLLGAILFLFASSAVGSPVSPVLPTPDKAAENSEVAGATNPNEDLKRKFERPGPEPTDVKGRAGGASGNMIPKKKVKKTKKTE